MALPVPGTNPPAAVDPAVAARELADTYRVSLADYLKSNCFRCHSDAKAAAKLNLQQLKPDFSTSASLEMWQRVYERTRDGEMPPQAMNAEREQETPAASEARFAFLAALKKVLTAAGPRDPLSGISFAPIPIAAEDSSLLRLKKQRRNAAAQSAELQMEYYRGGRSRSEEVIRSLQDVAAAEYDVATLPAERVAALQKSLALARTFEELVYQQTNFGTATVMDCSRARAARLKIQIQLEEERASQKPASTGRRP
jgi:hypothetical protein